MSQTIKRMHAPELKKLFESTVNDINKINSAIDSIEAQRTQISNAKDEILGDNNTGGILGNIKQKQIEAEEKLNIIKEVYANIVGSDEDENDDGLQGELKNLLAKSHSTQERLKAVEKEMYGHEEKTPTGEEKHINGLAEKITIFFDAQRKKYTEIYNKIENELLAGATTVGLSKAYEDKSNSYKTPNQFWLIVFFVSIAFIIMILFFSLSDISSHFFDQNYATDINGIKNFNNQAALVYFSVKAIIRIGIISSLIWVASFAGKRYSQNKRLSEEYSYKATFAKSFEGYRKKADELDQLAQNRDLSEKLMNNMIEMNAFNPVETMESKSHKEEHPTMKILEKAIDTIEKSINLLGKTK